jgi:hypothetical protein
MRSHTRCRPYHCNFCDKDFSTIGNRNDHERRHTGERPYHCPIVGCDKSFYRKGLLLSHADSVKHRNLPAGWFKYLVSEMPAPDLRVRGANSSHYRPDLRARAHNGSLGGKTNQVSLTGKKNR